MADAFDAGALEERYAFLDECPEDILQDVVTLPVGTIEERVAGVSLWRAALLAGTLPSRDAWPPPEVSDPVRRALEEMGLARFCSGQADLVDALMRDIMKAFAAQADIVNSAIAARLRELEALERERLRAEEAKRRDRKTRRAAPAMLDADARRRLRLAAERDVAGRAWAAAPGLTDGWSELARAWAEISDVFGDLGGLLGRGWDLSLGVLRHTGWLELVQLRRLVEQLPQLREVVRSLGRLQDSTSGESIAETLFAPVRRLMEELRDTPAPHVPTETRGVERGAEISRMLPVEAAMLGHPKLKLLWHGRRAERALLTYRVQGVETERVLVEREDKMEVQGTRPRPERGPVIAVIDTSGSMQGLPEQVAKAVVLEALRTAHAERRRCFLYSFSGPDQIAEHELDISADGLDRLLAFLGMSFAGGTDTSGPLDRVLQRLAREEWAKADVLVVTDGEWPSPDALLPRIRAAKEDGTRFHGVQIGNRGPTGLHAVCDPVHEFSEWAALRGM
ncbi:MAG: Protein ViaA [Planctomycetes bacterium]|nr:Protein ViaA [Planctomycetota bacterium]